MDNHASAAVTSETEDFLGTTSDYILIAMITAMMMFMTLCCLCLFCRTTSRCTICGFDFEVNDEPSMPPNIEDLDEIHEVVPLTPTSRDDDYRLPDIERMLQGDPPPPRYSEVATPRRSLSRGSIFRWSRRSSSKHHSKHLQRNLTLPEQKEEADQLQGKTQRSRSLMLRRPRFSFHRSRSYQTSQQQQQTPDPANPQNHPQRPQDAPLRFAATIEKIDEAAVTDEQQNVTVVTALPGGAPPPQAQVKSVRKLKKEDAVIEIEADDDDDAAADDERNNDDVFV